MEKKQIIIGISIFRYFICKLTLTRFSASVKPLQRRLRGRNSARSQLDPVAVLPRNRRIQKEYSYE